MARAGYIYLIRGKLHKNLLGAFTVKHEARTWVHTQGWHIDDLELSRMRDGICSKSPIGKEEELIEWPELLI